jgi:hypothetical protein
MARMVGDPKCELNHRSNTPAGPDLSPKAIRFGTPVQELGQTGELLGRESAWGPWRGPAAEGSWAPLTRTRHPLADGGFADPEGFGNLPLRPAFLLELPGLEPSGFLPCVG